jgi:hypothetical protein
MNQHQLDHFPDDVLLIILSYLTSKQLIESVFCLNHKWNALGKRDYLWKQLCMRDFEMKHNNVNLNWYEEYKKRGM